MLNRTHRQPQGVIDRAHPLRVALGEIVVNGDDMDATASQRVERDRQGGSQRFTFAGAHFGDLALMQDDATHQLDIVVPLFEHPFRGFARNGE